MNGIGDPPDPDEKLTKERGKLLREICESSSS